MDTREKIINQTRFYYLRYFKQRNRTNLKILLALVLILSFMYLFRSPDVDTTDHDVLLYRMERYMKYQTRPEVRGPGEKGAKVVLTPEEQKVADRMIGKASFNVVASDKMALNRSIPDTRRLS